MCPSRSASSRRASWARGAASCGESILDRVFRFIIGHPWVTLGVLAGLTLAALSQIVDPSTGRVLLEIDPSENRLLPEDDEGKQFYDFTRKAFGNDETMLVAVHADDVFTQDTLERISRLTDRLEEVEGVHHVVSLANAVDLRGTEDGIDSRPFFEEVPLEPAALEELRQRVLGNPLYAGSLVSADSKTTGVMIHFLNFSDREFINRGTDAEISAIVEAEAGDARVWLTGGPHVKVAQVEYQLRDLQRSIPLILVALAIVLAFSFRTARGVVLPLLSISIALVWTLGIAGWSGRPLNLVTNLVPALMLILGLSYAVHVTSEYYDELEDADEEGGAVYRTVMHVWLPVALTALTTGAGFLALALSPIGAISEFGWLAVVGVAASTLASLTLVPALLTVLGRPRRAGPSKTGPFARMAGRLAQFNLEHRTGVIAAYAVVFVLACLASSQMRVGGNSIKTFPPDAPVRTDFEAVNQHLDGANPFNIVVRSTARRAFTDPANLRAVDELEAWLVDQPEIGGTTSVVDFIKMINRAAHEDDPTYLRVPESKRLTTQLLFLAGGDELDGYLNRGRDMANIAVRANVIERDRMGNLVERIERRMADLPDHLEGTVTGNPILRNRLANSITTGQVQSMLLALIFIYAILVVFFLDPRTAFRALLPNALVIAVFFGALGATGVTLNLATSIIGPMALGIAIDDTIHYFVRFTQDAKRFADERKAMGTALLEVGRPVTYTTIAICSGFLILTTSDLLSQIQVGALGAFTLAFAWLVDVTLTPALCAGSRVVTLWDTLTLDLGAEPQHSIRLFNGLTKTQCRVVALMASLRQLPKGERFIHVGEAGREMYVIIDGKVEISVDGPNGRRLLNTCGRGEVVGDVGYFRGSRSTNADVVEDARVLRLTQNNMQRLSRRYPRTASRVFANLGEVLANRLARREESLSAPASSGPA